ncbi:centrosomal protein of 55 kDa isoform X2 [Protopterus annectens]|uniref:centrosomal protein of 55 kDa isoform X2 n=2 Tax=Protopterus annectens TaxID=7888 RepID=UPI001CF9306B|nr:centrosomal protein of 55 kDa isoform X2 [Protopterus annectens]
MHSPALLPAQTQSRDSRELFYLPRIRRFEFCLGIVKPGQICQNDKTGLTPGQEPKKRTCPGKTGRMDSCDMTSKFIKDFVTKPVRSETDLEKPKKENVLLEKLKKENVLLKKSIADMTKGKGKLSDVERNRLLEKILSLETIKEDHIFQLEVKEIEIQELKAQISSGESREVAVLRSQLMEKNKEADGREQLFKTLSEEAENLKNKMAAVTLKCEEVENTAESAQPSKEGIGSQKLSEQSKVLQDQLQDALEKNKQWLVYDQQREAYVRGLLARIFELEQQVGQVNQGTRQHQNEPASKDQLPEEKQKYYDKLLMKARKDLEAQKENNRSLTCEISELRKEFESKQREIEDLNMKLHRDQEEFKQNLERENAQEQVQKLKAELQFVKTRLDEEKKQSSELSSKLQSCTFDFENEKLDRQSLQRQLNKVLKELRKEREQRTHLETFKNLNDYRCSDSSSRYLHNEFEERNTCLLDESFLECPKCKAQYLTSQHRELLAHIDFCMD